MALPGPSGPYSSTSLSDVPYNQKWELLKPHIHRLYLDENRPLTEVISTMQRDFGFHAEEPSYKYYINRKWKMKKNIPAAKKSAMVDILQSRAKAGKSTTLKYKGKNVDDKKLRRAVKDYTRQQTTMQPMTGGFERSGSTVSQSVIPFGNRIFLTWNMPYGTMQKSRHLGSAGPSPPGMAMSTPSDIFVASPLPHNMHSPATALSPMSIALMHKTAVDRAHLFVQGRHVELLRSMNQNERRDMSTWLYQFWLFSVRTAKNWGRGPRAWTADLLGFGDMEDLMTISSPNTPGSHQAILGGEKGSSRSKGSSRIARTVPAPSSLCRWAIHIIQPSYQPLPDPPEEGLQDPDDESTWRPWINTERGPSFDETLRNGLESNDFSSLKAADLPIAVSHIVKAAQKSADELLLEAIGFSIIGGNLGLMIDLIEQTFDNGLELQELYPFHLATSYLDGSRNCCLILDTLIRSTPLRRTYTNSLGHTILDNLMIAILKAHTLCTPGEVDDVWQKEKRFVGEEVDICGRFVADSSCIQTLLKSGEVSIPFEWKHKFCHTSAQTITHCIDAIFVSASAPEINTASGIFLKRCTHCGLKLQLYPLHSLVVTSFALAQKGASGEDLFGVLACLLCLLWHGANPLLVAPVSLAALFHEEYVDQCSHEELRAIDIADRLMSEFQDSWTEKLRTGWQLFCFLLRSCHEEWQSTKSALDQDCDLEEMDIDSDLDDSAEQHILDDPNCNRAKHGASCHFRFSENFSVNFFGNNKDLGTFFAAVQTELLTYRRLAENDGWTSGNFNMREILWSLTTEAEPRIGLIENGLMKRYCQCGKFFDDVGVALCAEQACETYFMNMEDWSRTSFIDVPSREDMAN